MIMIDETKLYPLTLKMILENLGYSNKGCLLKDNEDWVNRMRELENSIEDKQRRRNIRMSNETAGRKVDTERYIEKWIEELRV